MATLFNTKISETYEGLLKTIDNAAISATLKELTDGSGNQSGLYLNTAGDFKVSNILEWGSLKDTGTGVTITRYVTSTDGLENFDNNTSLPTSAAVKLYVDTKFATSDTLQEVLVFGNTTGGNDIVVSANDDITFTDSSKALFGNSQDLEINHNGTDSFITDLGTGDLRLRSDNVVKIQASTGGNNLATFTKGAGVDLYFNNAKKLETTNTGISVTGIISNVTNPIDAQDAATKNYVDGLDAGSDLDITDGTTAGAVNLNTQSLSILGTTNEIETVVSGQGVTIGLPSSISTNLVGDVTGNLTGDVTGNLTGTASQINITTSTVDQNNRVLLSLGFNGSQSVINDAGLLFNPVTNLLTVDGSGTITGDLNVTGNITGGGGSFLPLAGGTMTGDTLHGDNVKSIYGAGSDLEIYHDGTNNNIKGFGGNLEISANNLVLKTNDDSETMGQFIRGGKVELFFDNVAKFRTTNTGISVTGNGAFSGNVSVPDSAFLYAGTSDDLSLTHNGTDSIIRNYTGDFYINQGAVTQSIIFKVSDANALDTTALTISRNGDLTTGRDVTIAGDLTVNGTTTTVNSQTLSVDDPLISLAINNAANSLDIGYYGKYNDGTTRYLGLFNDASDSNKFKLFKGTTVEPTTTVDIGAAGYAAADLELANLVATGNINLADNGKAIFGTGNDLQIYHDGSNSLINDSGTGSLLIRTSAFRLQNTGGEDMIAAFSNDSVKLYYDNSQKLATTSTGVSVTGDGTFSGKVTINKNIGTAWTSSLRANEFLQINNLSTVSGTFSGIELIATGAGSAGAAEIVCIDSGSGSGDLAFSTRNNSSWGERMRITSGGNVGIGTDNPDTTLHVDGGNANSVATFESTDDTARIILKDDDTAGYFIAKDNVISIGGSTTIANNLNVDVTSGNVGIGTDSPSYKLDVESSTTPLHLNRTGGATALIGLDIAGVTRGLIGATTTAAFVSYSSAAATLITVLNTGNVGIGTDSPSARLEVAASATTSVDIAHFSNSNDTVKIKHALDGLGSGRVSIFDASNNEDVRFSAQGNSWFNAGNVGIGTDSPDTLLEISGNSQSSTPALRINCTDASVQLNQVTGSVEFSVTDASSPGAGVKSSINSIALNSIGSHYGLGFNTTSGANNVERMRIDSAGNVGIGTDSPNNFGFLEKVLNVSAGSSSSTTLQQSGLILSGSSDANDGNDFSYLSFTNHQSTLSNGRVAEIRVSKDGNVDTGSFGFYTSNGSNPTEKMRITSAGDVLIGTEGIPNGTTFFGSAFVKSTLGRRVLYLSLNTTNSNIIASFYNPNGRVGTIATSGSATSYNTSSDYRLKEDLQDFNGLDKVSKIPVYDFKWKTDESRSYGVMAHELQEVLPDAVSGEKDAEEMQGVDYSKIVPLLIKSIQELTAKVEMLEAK